MLLTEGEHGRLNGPFRYWVGPGPAYPAGDVLWGAAATAARAAREHGIPVTVWREDAGVLSAVFRVYPDGSRS